MTISMKFQDDVVHDSIPSINDLVTKETVDILPYMDWEQNNFDKDEKVCDKHKTKKRLSLNFDYRNYY